MGNQGRPIRLICGSGRVCSERSRWSCPPRPLAPISQRPVRIHEYGCGRTTVRFGSPAQTAPSGNPSVCLTGTRTSLHVHAYRWVNIARLAGRYLRKCYVSGTERYHQFRRLKVGSLLTVRCSQPELRRNWTILGFGHPRHTFRSIATPSAPVTVICPARLGGAIGP